MDSKFGLETSVACQADRVELYDVINGKLVTMDNSNENVTVFCGDGQFNNLNLIIKLIIKSPFTASTLTYFARLS